MGRILSRKVTRGAWLQAKLGRLSPFLLPSLTLVSNHRNLFPDWNRARQRWAIRDHTARSKKHTSGEELVALTRTSHPSSMQEPGKQGKWKCYTARSNRSVSKINHHRHQLRKELQSSPHFTERLSLFDPQHLCASMRNSVLKSQSSAP